MTRGGPIVLAKVGGSLMDWPALHGRLGEFVNSRLGRGERLVLIAGGGGAADWVRALDRVHSLGEAKAHALAVRSLDLSARALAAIVPGLVVVDAVEGLPPAWESNRVPVLVPRLPLEEEDRDSPDPLPHSWDTTTDSIAARLAARLGAETLILLKSTGVPPGTTRSDAARLGVVDPIFPVACRAVRDLVLINLRDPDADEVFLE